VSALRLRRLRQRICENKMELENPLLKMPVAPESPLKEMVVTHIGETLQPENGDVTVEMAVEVFAAEFPEFLFAVAEENFLRGYQQALDDISNAATVPEESTVGD